MLIHHYYPHTRNVGDYFVRDGIRSLFSRVLGETHFVDIPVAKPSVEKSPFGIKGDNILRNNSDADLIIIGGSNMYEAHPDGGWGVDTTLSELKKIKTPIILIGIGTGSRFGVETHQLSPEKRSEIIYLNERALASSVRDMRTYDFIRSLGISQHTMTGCPATFKFQENLRGNNSKEIAISFPPARLQKFRFTFWHSMRVISKYIDYCIKLGFRPILACHDPRDVPIAERFKSRATVFFSDSPDDFYKLYGDSALVVGFRLHAAIISLSLGTPFIPIYFDHRGAGFLETYEAMSPSLYLNSWTLLSTLKKRTDKILARNFEDLGPLVRKKEELERVMADFVSGCATKINEIRSRRIAVREAVS
jgi:polysaccharide pyruvyl transferase WcaK-like protein